MQWEEKHRVLFDHQVWLLLWWSCPSTLYMQLFEKEVNPTPTLDYDRFKVISVKRKCSASRWALNNEEVVRLCKQTMMCTCPTNTLEYFSSVRTRGGCVCGAFLPQRTELSLSWLCILAARCVYSRSLIRSWGFWESSVEFSVSCDSERDMREDILF